MSIVALGSVDAFFQEIVDDSVRRRGVEASQEATRYIVALLAEQAHHDAAHANLDRPLAFLLEEALQIAPPAERFQRLRMLGDGVLYTSGFFADHFEARGVEPSYLVGIGTAAYGHAAAMLRRGHDDAPTAPDLFRELAERFAEFKALVADVAHATVAMGVKSSKNVLALYETWLRTGSERLAQALTAQGLMPVRGGRGVQ